MNYDVIIIGAGAAGLMCAIEAGRRGRKTCVIDHSKKPAEKIRISGGGRCNFTNIYTNPETFLSTNPHFCKSALSRYTQYDFIDMVTAHNIPYHEKKLGQLFCDNSAQNIIDMLVTECTDNGVEILLETSVSSIEKTDGGYKIKCHPELVSGSHGDQTLKQVQGDETVFTLYRYAFGPLDAAAYLISKEGAKKLEQYCLTLHTPIDILMDRTYDHGVTAYGVLPYAASTQFNFEKDDPLFTDIGIRDKKYADDITKFEKICVRYHRLVGSAKRHLATLRLAMVKE